MRKTFDFCRQRIILNMGDTMKDKKFHLFKKDNQPSHVYLEMNDLKDVSVEIWEPQDGDRKTHVRIKMSNSEWEKLISEYECIQTVQETCKRIEV